MTRTGLNAGFGAPLLEPRPLENWAHGFSVQRQDLQTDQGWTPDLDGCLAQGFAWEQRGGRMLYVVSDRSTLWQLPRGAWFSWRNEPKMSAAQWAAEANALEQDVRDRGLVFWAYGQGNFEQRNLDWLREAVRLCPWPTHVEMHRYSPGENQDPNKAHKGFSSRDAEVAAFKSIIGGRAFLIGECGYHTGPMKIGWLKPHTEHLTARQQADRLHQEIAFWTRHGAEACVLYQEQDGPTDTAKQRFGLRYAGPGDWKTDDYYGAPNLYRAIAVITCDEAGTRLPGVAVTLDDQPAPHTGATDANGEVTWPEVSAGMTACHLWASKEGYAARSEHLDLTANINQQVWLGGTPVQPTALRLDPMRSLHVDPSGIPLETLVKFRGGMWTVPSAVPYGPRPGKPDNVCAMDYFEWFTEADQETMLRDYQARGYIHAVTGPPIDSGGYHFDYPTYPGPLTQEWWDHTLDCYQVWWDRGIIPTFFACPDEAAWPLDRIKAEMEPFFRQERAQKLIRVVLAAWEPDWESARWEATTAWLADVFSNALRGVHFAPKHSAPGRGDEIIPGVFEEAQMWEKIAAYIHFFWEQTRCTWEGPPDEQAYWLAMWNPAMVGSWVSRFSRGYAGWPTFSAWPTGGIRPFPSEFWSWTRYHENASEAEGQKWGDDAMRMGAEGYMDGGTLPPR